MRRLVSARSSRTARIISSNFRHGVRRVPSHRFFANCCVIVLPPRTTFLERRFRRAASLMPAQSKPSCEKNLSSSATSTAARSAGAMASSFTACWDT